MDLIGGYLLVMLVCFCGNIALLLGNYDIGNVKLILYAALAAIISFVLMFLSSFSNADLMDYMGYVFFIIFFLLFISMIFYVKKSNLKQVLVVVLSLSIISVAILSSQSDLDIFRMLLYSLFVFIVFFVVYQLSKLLRHAKRQYSVIIGEYMSLFSILIFIFSLTYSSIFNLNYSMFRPFLILTPTYQLIYVVIVIVVILIAGVFLNDVKGGNS